MAESFIPSFKVELKGELKNMLEGVAGGVPTSVFGLGFGERTHLSALLSSKFKVLYVARDIIAAKNVLSQMQSLLGSGVYLLPPRADIITFSRAQSFENEFERIKTLFALSSGDARVVVTCPQAITQRYPDQSVFLDNIITLKVGRQYDLANLPNRLTMAGFRREVLVSAVGQFSARGDIVDIFPINQPNPVRLSFFGDELESIKVFNLETQSSISSLDSLEICPSTTVFLTRKMQDDVVRAMYRDYNGKLERNYDGRIRSIMSEIELRIEGGRELALGFIEPYIADMVGINSYFTFGVVVFDDVKQVYDNVEAVYKEHNERLKHLLSVGEALPSHLNALLSSKDVFLGNHKKLAFHNIMSQNRAFSPSRLYDFKTVALPKYGRDTQSLVDDTRRWILDGYKVVFACTNGERAQMIREAINSFDNPPSPIYLAAEAEYGFVYHDIKLVVLGAFELGVKKPKRMLTKNKTDLFEEIKSGDYVVHIIHGVGRFVDVVRMGAHARDYFKLVYAGGDILYVPIENMDSLSKFNATSDSALNKLGGTEFKRAVKKARESVKKLAFSLLELYAQRQANNPKLIDFDEGLLKLFSDSFPFEETRDQLLAIDDIKNDFRSQKRMDRLICGDVGYGKTEVALRAAFMAASSGLQVALLAPTTILTEQHYHTARGRLEPLGLRVECLSRFKTQSEARAILDSLKQGKIDVICGTHRLLSKDVEFFDLGLLILDEEQRFGVGDKEKIRLLKKDINVLTLTATPIPRTLHMSLTGIRDISIINTPPEERIAPQVYVSEYSQSLVFDAVMREVSRGGQVFIVYNRVEKIAAFAHSLRSFMPNINITVAHGQMPPKQLESAIADFYDGRSEVLLCSTIIENGVDFARANTMIVCDSDMFGLSTLYQLRGRVGRSNRLAYVYFTFDGDKILTENAYKRLDTITEFTEFGSGFKIALKDLEIRGAGNVLGSEQHGHLDKIGYEMYSRLLNEEIRRLKLGEGETNIIETTVYTDLEAYVPKKYIEGEHARIRLFKLISELKSESARLDLICKTEEIYGKMPIEVLNLILVGLIKNLAAKIYVKEVVFKRKQTELRFISLKDIPENVLNSISNAAGCSLKLDQHTAISFEGNDRMQKLKDFLTKF